MTSSHNHVHNIKGKIHIAESVHLLDNGSARNLRGTYTLGATLRGVDTSYQVLKNHVINSKVNVRSSADRIHFLAEGWSAAGAMGEAAS